MSVVKENNRRWAEMFSHISVTSSLFFGKISKNLSYNFMPAMHAIKTLKIERNKKTLPATRTHICSTDSVFNFTIVKAPPKIIGLRVKIDFAKKIYKS